MPPPFDTDHNQGSTDVDNPHNSDDTNVDQIQATAQSLTTKDYVLLQVATSGVFLLVILPILSLVPAVNVASKSLAPRNTLGIDLSGTLGTVLDTAMSLIITLVNSVAIPRILQCLTSDTATAAFLSLAGRSTFTVPPGHGSSTAPTTHVASDSVGCSRRYSWSSAHSTGLTARTSRAACR